MSKYVQSCYSSCSKGLLQGEGGKCGCFTCLRLIPYPVAINSLGSLELEFSEANHFGKVDKARNFAIIKLLHSCLKCLNAK